MLRLYDLSGQKISLNCESPALKNVAAWKSNPPSTLHVRWYQSHTSRFAGWYARCIHLRENRSEVKAKWRNP
jgi:hypothetical protein